MKRPAFDHSVPCSFAEAVASALSFLGAKPDHVPLSPPRAWKLIDNARNVRA
jgi:hypothetical protein